MIVTDEEFLIFARYIYNLTGQLLDGSKKYLIENRFDQLARELECSTITELYFKSLCDPGKSIQRRIIDIITTHETSFFRDTRPFELFKSRLLKKFPPASGYEANPFPQTLHIWCAACATGQEIYSIALAAKETHGDAAYRLVRILGTDISHECIDRANGATYTPFEVERGLSPDRLAENFTFDGKGWKVKEQLRTMVTFQRLNLLDDFSHLGKFDIIFCRNVSIYFSEEDKKSLFERLARHVWNDGILVIGSTETLVGVTDRFLRIEDEYGVYFVPASTSCDTPSLHR